MVKKQLTLLLLLCVSVMVAQDYFPTNTGVKSVNTNYTAFVNAKIYINPTKIVENGTLLIYKSKVVGVGKSVEIPKNTVIFDLKGKSIYPSFIDVYSSFGIAKAEKATGRTPQYNASREGFYWNDHILPDQNAINVFTYDKKAATQLINAGFGVVNTHIADGIVRGTGALVALTDKGGDHNRIIDGKSGQYLSLKKSVKSHQAYPTSIMGTLALLRQMYNDVNWYKTGQSETKDKALEALIANQNLVQIIEAGSDLNDLRVDKVGDEFGIQYVIVGGGDEYKRIDKIKQTNATYILPINFPKAYDVEDTFLTSVLSLADMKAWSQKPYNPKILADNKIEFALSTKGLNTIKEFKTNLHKAIAYGLDKTIALEALTTVPARILGKSNQLGTLNKGMYANFLITSGDIFDEKTILYENWIKGNKVKVSAIDVIDIRGDYTTKIDTEKYDINIFGSIDKPKAKVKTSTGALGSKLRYKNDWLYLTIAIGDSVDKKFIRLSSRISNSTTITGKAILSNGNEVNFVANKTPDSKVTDKTKKSSKKDVFEMSPITFPNVAYGFDKQPTKQTLLFKNATVWTNEVYGILKNTDVLVKDGKIFKIGTNLKLSSATVIDATGKHLTAGIIDEHSHIATSAVNEAGHNSTAEVSIEEAVNPDDVNIYRNLAGGVTSIQILHGSANPIGGQSAIIKLKWGESANDLIYENSPKFIKFALGENVKQSNWGDNQTVRFPQTRMGVEQVFKDYFTRAQSYDKLKSSGVPYRKDQELEVLSEILKGERFISCHSYVQSEINMLMKVAESFNFKINTFTHILEGYKVADKMKAHGVAASTFSDWWAYKFEVNDAIPYNASILHNAGVLTAINSDDAEMSRRLNHEAAKTVKYGGVSEEDAWKFITLNPAKMLHLDDRVGSVKVGKDADLVLWSGHPMSVYSKAEKTIIEGVTYFDLERDKMLRNKIKKERNQLIKQMLQHKNKGLKTQPIIAKKQNYLHCDSE